MSKDSSKQRLLFLDDPQAFADVQSGRLVTMCLCTGTNSFQIRDAEFSLEDFNIVNSEVPVKGQMYLILLNISSSQMLVFPLHNKKEDIENLFASVAQELGKSKYDEIFRISE